MGLLDSGRPPSTIDEAGKALEALFLKQLLSSSGAFKATNSAGSSLHVDLFVEALADAVAATGGLGIGAAIAGSVRGTTAPRPPPGSMATLSASRGEKAAALDLLALVEGPARVSSGFGSRADPFSGKVARHGGVDVAAPEGSPIRVAANGVVVRAGARGGYGNAVEVEHPDGTSTLYAHARELLVGEGDRVRAGQTIASIGATGRATGPHLHFEVREGGRPVHPERALKIYLERVEPGVGDHLVPRSRAP